ncbi:MAG TPA: D-aminoacylase [Gemmatimonadaceae bacterium]|nr:D-aminoacylase [Gemmatimonadaceae bacterium]
MTRRPSIPRRDFIATASAALAAIGCGGRVGATSGNRWELVVRGGTIVDGSGGAPIEGDVAIAKGRIAAIGRSLAGTGDEEVDARGLVVAPGFIDIHSHADGTIFEDPRAESIIRQGITTVVVGQDGSSRAPAPEHVDTPRERMEHAMRVGGRYDSIGDFLAGIDRLPPAVNFATMVGLGTIRGAVVGDADRPATREEILRMHALVGAALNQGACGASSGLEYVPGAFASQEELAALCQPLAEARLPYATHMRNEDDRLLESIDESIAVARTAGCPLQIAHLKTQGPRNWPKIGAALERVDKARADGLDVAFDRYPYVAYQTGLTNLFPPWSRDGGTERFLERLRDSSTSSRIRNEAIAKVELIGGWNNVQITSVRNAADRAAEGQRLGAWAQAQGLDPYEATVGLLERSAGDVGMVGFAMSEENIERFLAHPLGMVCSDGGAFATEGPARRGHPHPRSLGSFPRVLGRYVRERRALTLQDAVRKMSAFPASRVRLTGRGMLRQGYAADVVVFDPSTVTDTATFAEPFRYPEGIRVVIVNGVTALRDGARAERRAGRALRPF